MSKPTLQARAQFLGDVPNPKTPIAELWMMGARTLLDEALAEIERLNGAFSDGAKWVSTEQRKPEDGQTVLAYWATVGHCPASYESLTYHASDAPDSRECWSDVFGSDDDEPTHWMPLPEAPK